MHDGIIVCAGCGAEAAEWNASLGVDGYLCRDHYQSFKVYREAINGRT